MHKISLVTVGSVKTSWIAEGSREYSTRISHDVSFEVIEISPSKQKDPAKQSAEESVAILKRLEKAEGEIWALDEKGQEMSSQKFADAIGGLMDQGIAITFVLGGAYGLGEDIRRRGNRIVRLSVMTFPHELCRLVILEQLYRALQIRKGTGYHHGN